MSDLGEMAEAAGSILIALALAGCIGWEREQDARTAGLRTFPLVAAASCAYILIIRDLAPDGSDAQARVLYGLMTGIGFVGGGAILRDRGSVRGTATAAAIWNTGAIGAAVGFGQVAIAVVLTLVNVGVFFLVKPIKETLGAEDAGDRHAGESDDAREDAPSRPRKRREQREELDSPRRDGRCLDETRSG